MPERQQSEDRTEGIEGELAVPAHLFNLIHTDPTATRLSEADLRRLLTPDEQRIVRGGQRLVDFLGGTLELRQDPLAPEVHGARVGTSEAANHLVDSSTR